MSNGSGIRRRPFPCWVLSSLPDPQLIESNPAAKKEKKNT
jgi:hypothetical protein